MRPHVPPAALKVIDEELDKLQGLEQASSEFNVTRNYLDWLTQMPWGKHTQERLEIDHAQQVGQDMQSGMVGRELLCSMLVLRGTGRVACIWGEAHTDAGEEQAVCFTATRHGADLAH